MSKIKNIVFDMGQVLYYYRPDEFIRSAGVADNELPAVRRAIFEGVTWVKMDRGTADEDELTAEACGLLPQHLHRKAEEIVRGWWKSELSPVPGMADLLKELKRAGYMLYLLSNAGLSIHQYFRRIPGWDCFDGKIISAEHKLLKPQPEIYCRLFECYSLVPEECVFVDDAPANVEAAMLCGMDGIIFRDDVRALRAELRKKGILI